MLCARGTSEGGDRTVWTLASVAPEDSPTARQIITSGRWFEKATGNRVRVRARFGGVLGDETSTLELTRQGKVQMWAGSTGAMVGQVPAIAVLETPYLFPGVAALERAVTPAVLDEALDADFRARGLVGYAAVFIGWRAMTSRERAIRAPGDLAGVRVRSQSSPLHLAMWKRLGAQAEPSELTELNNMFRLRRVEVADVPLTYVFAASLPELAKFHTRTNHMMQSGMLVFHRGARDALPEPARQGLDALRTRFCQELDRLHDQLEQELVAAVGKQLTVIEPSADERKAWHRALSALGADAERLGGPKGKALLASARRSSGEAP